MKNKNAKSKTLLFSAYECTAIEEFLEEMALEGWLLESIKISKFKFTKIEPKKIKYSVELVSQVSSLDGPNSKVAMEYREFCEAAGWTYVCDKNKLQVFYSNDYENAIPIHTDENEKFKAVFKSSLTDIFFSILLILVFSFNIYNSIAMGDISYFLSSNLSILAAIATLFLIAINTLEIISFVTWSIKANIKIKQCESVSYNTYKQVKRKSLTLKIINVVIVLAIIYGFLFSSNDLSSLLLSLLMPIILIVIIMMFDKLTNKFLYKKSYSRNKKLIIKLGSIAFTFVVLMLTIFSLVMVVVENPSYTRNKILDNLPLTFTDFNLSTPSGDDVFTSRDKSIIGEKISYYNYSDNGSLDYTLFESDYPWAISAMEKSLIKYNKSLTEPHSVKYIDSPKLVNGLKIYVSNFGTHDIIVSENKILSISDGFNKINHEEFLNVVINTIFK